MRVGLFITNRQRLETDMVAALEADLPRRQNVFSGRGGGLAR